MNVSVVGLGKLGAPIAAWLADGGHSVFGVDTNPRVVEALNLGKAPYYEPGLEELIRRNAGRVSASTDLNQAIVRSKITFILVPTPSESDGSFSLRHVLPAVEGVGRALRQKESYHLVVLSSTVMPGSTGGWVLPALEQASGKRCGGDFGLCYNPEFIALGTVLRDLCNPDMILIGESDDRAGKMLARLLAGLCKTRPSLARMNFVNAEITKISVNTYITAKISYANMLAEICEGSPGADVEVVTTALGLDSRIGPRYLKGALGYGGPCFPRDNLALARLASQVGASAELAEATDRINRRQVGRLARLVLDSLSPGHAAGILGLSYKPGTDVIEESQGIALAEELLARGVSVIVYDPAALQNSQQHLKGNVKFASSSRECLRNASVVAITTDWPEFRGISPRDLNFSNGTPTVIDCWRILDRKKFERSAHYVGLGEGRRLKAGDSRAVRPQPALVSD